jgi:hypothetical protein
MAGDAACEQLNIRTRAASGVLIAFRASRTVMGVAGGMKTACADGIFVVFNAGEIRSAARSG